MPLSLVTCLTRYYSTVSAITVAHGGWSEFRICPNNDIHRTVTQECLDAHLLETVEGKTRYYHPIHTGNFTVQLVLPKGLICSQCVIQWWWKTSELLFQSAFEY